MRWESIWREKGFVKGATRHVARNWAKKKSVDERGRRRELKRPRREKGIV